MKTSLQANDDVLLEIKEDSIIELFHYEDYELNSPIEKRYKQGDEIECTILEVDENKLDIQFFDGFICFLRHSLYEIVSIN